MWNLCNFHYFITFHICIIYVCVDWVCVVVLYVNVYGRIKFYIAINNQKIEYFTMLPGYTYMEIKYAIKKVSGLWNYRKWSQNICISETQETFENVDARRISKCVRFLKPFRNKLANIGRWRKSLYQSAFSQRFKNNNNV